MDGLVDAEDLLPYAHAFYLLSSEIDHHARSFTFLVADKGPLKRDIRKWQKEGRVVLREQLGAGQAPAHRVQESTAARAREIGHEVFADLVGFMQNIECRPDSNQSKQGHSIPPRVLFAEVSIESQRDWQFWDFRRDSPRLEALQKALGRCFSNQRDRLFCLGKVRVSLCA